MAGALLGLLLWHVSGNVGGDGFFHLGRVQKLLAFGDLSTGAVDEFPDGGLHPGYAFPLWHGVLALVAKVSGADPVDVVLHAANSAPSRFVNIAPPRNTEATPSCHACRSRSHSATSRAARAKK